MSHGEAPLVVHVIHALGVGGLENGLVNLINHMPAERYRHAVICMTSFGDFRKRIDREDVEVIAMHRGTVPLWQTYWQLFRLFRRMKPSIVHTRNLSGLDALLPAFLAGTSVRVHGEHGRDADDLQGSNPRYQRLRRIFRPLITHYIAVSKDLERYLIDRIGVRSERITQIYNGVDTVRFQPPEPGYVAPYTMDALPRPSLVVGTIGRLQPVKSQVTLVKAFAQACRLAPEVMRAVRLVIVGDGPLRAQVEAEIEYCALTGRVVLLGERSDVADVLRSFDLFVLPSRDEGISNTILEAMATGIPILATRVGGNPELIREGEVGQLVASEDHRAMAQWIVRYVDDEALRRQHGLAGRRRAERDFSMAAMVGAYLNLYDRLRTDRLSRQPNNVKKSVIQP